MKNRTLLLGLMLTIGSVLGQGVLAQTIPIYVLDRAPEVELKGLSVWGLSLLILFVLLVTILLFHTLRRRLGAVAAYARAIADGKYSSTIDFVSSDKIGEMAESVSHMGSSMAALVDELEHKGEAAKRAARTAKRLAYYDSLTGLPNRHNFIEIAESAIEWVEMNSRF